jgi:hypothetical protein
MVSSTNPWTKRLKWLRVGRGLSEGDLEIVDTNFVSTDAPGEAIAVDFPLSPLEFGIMVA